MVGAMETRSRFSGIGPLKHFPQDRGEEDDEDNADEDDEEDEDDDNGNDNEWLQKPVHLRLVA